MEETMQDLQTLRHKALELLLMEEWKSSIHLYDQFISLCETRLSNTHSDPGDENVSKINKSLCLAFCNRAEARFRLRDFSLALDDCDRALELERGHFKTLLCKGKILLHLHRYAKASDCFKLALELHKNTEMNGFLSRCKKLEFQSRTGHFDLTDWVLNGFRGKTPELAEYVGPVQIKESENGGRGLFATKNVEAGSLLVVTEALAVGRAILPEAGDDSSRSAHLAMWKDFVEKILDASAKCKRTLHLIYMLSMGEDDQDLKVPEMNLFRPDAEDHFFHEEKPDTDRILKILDVNSLTEDSVSANVLGRNMDYCAVGLWILPSFINHACNPNARRLHIGDHIVVHTSRDVKAGEEISFAYFDVLLPLKKRREIAKTQWGFCCNCRRCRFEDVIFCKEDMREIERRFESGPDMDEVAVRLEELMKKWILVKGTEKGFLRASFWAAFADVIASERLTRRVGRRIPAVEMLVNNAAEATGADHRLLKLLVERLQKNNGGTETECVMKLARGVFGKVVKQQAMRMLCLNV
ncbi:methyltransferase FGSG_00040 [Aristolochia californica]|uniref:methyltransferase FGSG_00040 n=1 Tax=Aristolochia californica TaxID=171875 RepID=UPI0035D5EB36